MLFGFIVYLLVIWIYSLIGLRKIIRLNDLKIIFWYPFIIPILIIGIIFNIIKDKANKILNC